MSQLQTRFIAPSCTHVQMHFKNWFTIVYMVTCVYMDVLAISSIIAVIRLSGWLLPCVTDGESWCDMW